MELGPGADEIWISTFHSMCVRILRRDIDRIGINRNGSISSFFALLMEPKILLGSNFFGSIFRSFRIPLIVYTDYQKKLLKNQSLDFDDLIMTTIKLFERVPEVIKLKHFRHTLEKLNRRHD
jgi:DNA helicase-2/ATP-dependent DNA helicase PcrA